MSGTVAIVSLDLDAIRTRILALPKVDQGPYQSGPTIRQALEDARALLDLVDSLLGQMHDLGVDLSQGHQFDRGVAGALAAVLDALMDMHRAAIDSRDFARASVLGDVRTVLRQTTIQGLVGYGAVYQRGYEVGFLTARRMGPFNRPPARR